MSKEKYLALTELKTQNFHIMTKLNFNQLAVLQGADEDVAYCNTLRFILSHNCIEAGSNLYFSALYGWALAQCSGSFESYRILGCTSG